MKTPAQTALDPISFSTFTASLASLSGDEIRKAKALYIRNAIADYRTLLKTGKVTMTVLGF